MEISGWLKMIELAIVSANAVPARKSPTGKF
jgi:hypothetical protein